MQYKFEWDPKKAKQNIKKHGTSFEVAAEVLLDPRALTIFDNTHSEDEERWITMGRCKNGQLIVLCHTFEETPGKALIRIISARKPEKSEAKQYWRK